jgi:hypothetical protein
MRRPVPIGRARKGVRRPSPTYPCAQNLHTVAVASAIAMAARSGTRRRWLRRPVIAVLIVVLSTVLGACGSVMYDHALWEAGNRRCGEVLRPGQSGGWSIGFNGRTDAFVCTIHDAKVRVVARKEVPVEDVMGASGAVPYLPALIAHELEAVDDDAP